MHPVHDVDVVILMATALCAKKRPAELAEIVAAADLIQGLIPYESKLGNAIAQLSRHGLLLCENDRWTLTPPALTIVADQPRKAEMPERIAAVKEKLAAYFPHKLHPAIELSAQQLADAVQAHKATKKVPVKNLAMPKPKADAHFKVEGRWRCAPGARTRK
ncbi:MAG: hypothetical protein EKK46_12175 [Rhodocyclaceae bacterium]|nr:MAG: hypothetical protein EKK46_12175 [Rhodocyclaceae bacterium]